jgi:hypothetical protein
MVPPSKNCSSASVVAYGTGRRYRPFEAVVEPLRFDEAEDTGSLERTDEVFDMVVELQALRLVG